MESSENDWNGLNFLNGWNLSLRSGDARKTAVNDNDLPGDEAVVQDQA